MRQVLRAGALGRPRGMGRGGRREGGSGWGAHVNPWLIHVSVWQKPLQYCKVISLQLIKINEKKKTTILPRSQSLFPDQRLWGFLKLGEKKKNDIRPFVVMWMKLEFVLQNEVKSEREERCMGL